MTKTLVNRVINVQGSARQVQDQDLNEFDLILTMDKENYKNVMRLPSAEKHREKIQAFTRFCSHYDEEEVPDPYYGGQAGFEHVADMIEDGCQGIIAHLA